MTSHEDRAREYNHCLDLCPSASFFDGPSDPGYYCPDCLALAVEFQELLPAGSVAVDEKKLQTVLTSGPEEVRGRAFCNWPECNWETERGVEITPHSPDCPGGAPDAK